jgi:serine/threonine-protein kinase
LLAVAVLVLVVAGVAVGLYSSRPAPTYPVADLRRHTMGAAESVLRTEHLQLVVAAQQWSPSVPSGSVISQYPAPPARLHAGQAVSVILSLGPAPVKVPPLATLDRAQVAQALGSAGLRLGKVTRRSSMTVPDGIVISWSSRGLELLPGSVVNVVLSTGKPVVRVPVLPPGTTFAREVVALDRLHLRAHEVGHYNDTVAAGVVLSTVPRPGTKRVVGTTVTVNVSIGPHLVTIPRSIVGLDPVRATHVLSGLGIYVRGVQGSPAARVTSTQPATGARVRYGGAVLLVTN